MPSPDGTHPPGTDRCRFSPLKAEVKVPLPSSGVVQEFSVGGRVVSQDIVRRVLPTA